MQEQNGKITGKIPQNVPTPGLEHVKIEQTGRID
jgi:hypothetical protein